MTESMNFVNYDTQDSTDSQEVCVKLVKSQISTHRKNRTVCIEEHLALGLCLRVCAVVQRLIYIHIVGNTVEKHNLNECGLKAES